MNTELIRTNFSATWCLSKVATSAPRQHLWTDIITTPQLHLFRPAIQFYLYYWLTRSDHAQHRSRHLPRPGEAGSVQAALNPAFGPGSPGARPQTPGEAVTSGCWSRSTARKLFTPATAKVFKHVEGNVLMSALETTVLLLTKANALWVFIRLQFIYMRCTGAKLHQGFIWFKSVLPESMLLNFRTECYFQTYLFLLCLVQFLCHFFLEC